MGVYGQSKADGEKEIRLLLKEHIILRTSWLYGVYGQNFVKTMLKLAKDRKNIQVVSDQYGSPTSAADLAQAIWSIADLLHHRTAVDWGTYHYCGRGIVSWHEFAETIVDFARLYVKIKTIRVDPIKTEDYPTKARRPLFSAFNCSQIKKKLGIDPKLWQKSLKSTIQRLLSTDEGHFC